MPTCMCGGMGLFTTKFSHLGVRWLMLAQLLLHSTVADCVCHQVSGLHICAIWRSVDGFYLPSSTDTFLELLLLKEKLL